jgi:hypothetical protein
MTKTRAFGSEARIRRIYELVEPSSAVSDSLAI